MKFKHSIFKRVVPIEMLQSFIAHNCEKDSLGYYVFNKNSFKRSRPIFSEDNNPKNFIVTHDLETGNGYIDGNVYIDGKLKSITAGEYLLFKSESYIRDSQKVGSIRKTNSKSENKLIQGTNTPPNIDNTNNIAVCKNTT